MKSSVVDISVALLDCPQLYCLHNVRGILAIKGKGFDDAGHIFVDCPNTFFFLGGRVMAIVTAPQPTNAACCSTLANKPVNRKSRGLLESAKYCHIPSIEEYCTVLQLGLAARRSSRVQEEVVQKKQWDLTESGKKGNPAVCTSLILLPSMSMVNIFSRPLLVLYSFEGRSQSRPVHRSRLAKAQQKTFSGMPGWKRQTQHHQLRETVPSCYNTFREKRSSLCSVYILVWTVSSCSS